MILIKDISSFLKTHDSLVLTLGNFDGVHLGHQSLLKKVVNSAKERGRPAGVLIFYPHPLKVLPGRIPPPVLTTFQEKRALLASLGLDVLICLRFSRAMSEKTPDEFVRDILYERLNVNTVIVGHDYSFGKNRAGNSEFLKAEGKKYGFSVIEAEALMGAGDIISSTRIRSFLLEGCVEDAASCLGRPYSVSGVVSFGDKKGEALGVKTAKVVTKGKLLPKSGVYVSRVYLDNREYKAVLNIGIQPTFGDYSLALEVCILDFHKDIYHQTMRVEFLRRIREEKKFSSLSELKKRIEKDIVFAREYFSSVGVVC